VRGGGDAGVIRVTALAEAGGVRERRLQNGARSTYGRYRPEIRVIRGVAVMVSLLPPRLRMLPRRQGRRYVTTNAA